MRVTILRRFQPLACRKTMCFFIYRSLALLSFSLQRLRSEKSLAAKNLHQHLHYHLRPNNDLSNERESDEIDAKLSLASEESKSGKAKNR